MDMSVLDVVPLLAVLAIAVAVEMRTGLIPNWLTGTASLVLFAVAVFAGDALGFGLGALMYSVVLGGLYVAQPGFWGGGPVKLGFPVGGALGILGAPIALLLFLLGMRTMAWWKARGSEDSALPEIPTAPMMAGTAVFVLLLRCVIPTAPW